MSVKQSSTIRLLQPIHGFSLIEVLVAIVILSISLLGLASAQLMSLKQNNAALLRSQATQYAYDIADRIRSNPLGGTNYNLALVDVPTTSTSCVVGPHGAGGSRCNRQRMARFDLAQWYCAMNGDTGNFCNNVDDTLTNIDIATEHGLPNVQGAVTWDATAQRYIIEIQWLADNSRAVGDPMRTGTVVM